MSSTFMFALHKKISKNGYLVYKNNNRVLYVIPHAVLSPVAHVAHCILLLLTILESRPVPLTGIKVKYRDIPSRPGNWDQSQISSWCENPIPVVC